MSKQRTSVDETIHPFLELHLLVVVVVVVAVAVVVTVGVVVVSCGARCLVGDVKKLIDTHHMYTSRYVV